MAACSQDGSEDEQASVSWGSRTSRASRQGRPIQEAEESRLQAVGGDFALGLQHLPPSCHRQQPHSSAFHMTTVSERQTTRLLAMLLPVSPGAGVRDFRLS